MLTSAGFVVANARKQVAKRARREHYPGPYAILALWQNTTAIRLPRDGSVVLDHRAVRAPTTENLIRIFFLQER
jgi:3-hydroxyacyl-CoA dehydrogenase/enoyl-CoA hydratase/3-hydroxybutyryl-CoA epimerase